ncbi:hypothetical protein AFK68_04650 [Hydrocoleum sp. CS-953]|uniref:hypothetical protein n=1 Tax=Hydrocoleum sp. CS-953 TaxID=1671698 RepID=UPI000B9C120B|nr:hypothetical protein [Hydrocoleum sp. CS-953]OZH55435.1 hypothetical protein AFK68_04650 [Hydrocoleum sp. CS-953]
MIATAFTALIKPDTLVKKEIPENIAAKTLYYPEVTSTLNNYPEYQKELNKAKKLVLSLPNSEAQRNLINCISYSYCC